MKTSPTIFGQWLLTLRESQEKKRSDFARALGYKNINKGCKLLLRWERGEEDPEPSITIHSAIRPFLRRHGQRSVQVPDAD